MRKKDLKRLSEADFIGFDCFDTLIHRSCHPETIKQIWAKRVCRKYGLPITAKEFYKIRKASEEYLEKKSENGEYTYQELIQEIIKRHTLYFNGGNDKELFKRTQEIKQLEIELETQHQYLDHDNAEILKELYKQNKKIFLISDFYMGKEDVAVFLKRFSLDQYIQDIFVSCDLKKCKRNGTIFDALQQQFGFSSRNFVMVGDNKKSDVAIPRGKGFHAVFCRYRNRERNVTPLCVKRKISALYRKNRGSFTGYAYGLYLFSDNLYKMAAQTKTENLFFLSREGEFLKRIFDYLVQCRQGDEKRLSTHYFLGSRVATFAPGLLELKEETFETLVRQYQSISLNQFLRSIGFSENEAQLIRETYGFDMEQKIDDVIHSKEIKELISTPIFKELYEKNRREQRDNLAEYCSSFGIDFVTEGLHLVDVGWKGTIQDNLFRYFKGKVEVEGFYLGLQENGNLNVQNRKYGVLYGKVPFESEKASVWDLDFQFWEKILAGSHSAVKKYENKSINEHMVCFEEEHNLEYELIKETQEHIFHMISEIEAVFDGCCFEADDFKDTFAGIHRKMLCSMSRKEMELYLGLRKHHYENFGLFSYEGEHVKKRRLRLHNPFNMRYARAVYVMLDKYHLQGLFRIYGTALYAVQIIWGRWRKRYQII